LLRDFQKILERGGDSYPVGWYLRVQAEYLLMKWARVRDGTLEFFEFLAEFPANQTRLRPWLTIGLKASSSRTTETCGRDLSLSFYVMPSSLIGPVNLRLLSYPRTNLKPSSDLPPERIPEVQGSHATCCACVSRQIGYRFGSNSRAAVCHTPAHQRHRHAEISVQQHDIGIRARRKDAFPSFQA
jgi:hypothetical protein